MKLTRYQKTVMLILALTQFTVVLDFMIMAPLGEQLIKDLHLTTTQFGTVVSVYAISAAISSFLSAAFADRFDRKRLLLFFYTGFILGTLFCGLAAAYETMLAARIFTGIFGGVLSSVAL
ncbi:MAG: MFS transporter, partial [Bacteroidia bacterium]